MPMTKYNADVSELFLCVYFVSLIIFNIFFMQMSAIFLCLINWNKNTLQILCSVLFNLFAWTNNNK